MCCIYSIWVLVHFYATHAQLMLPNSIRLVETPLWHLNLKQNLLREVPTVAVLPSFPISLSSRCIPWSWKILAMFFVHWYFVWETFFWIFLQLKWQQPWAFFHTLFSSISTLCFFFSFSFWRVEFFTKFCLSISQIIVSVLPVSIVDRASI